MEDKKAALEAREAHRREQDQLLAIYDEVKSELMRIPGVVEVGVGLRERGGKLTHETAFRVYVEKKLPRSEVPPENLIPGQIRGFPIDVIEQRIGVKIIGFNDENDDTNYKTKVAGIRIGPDEPGAGTGTLGCFATLTADGTTVILSCHHVLMQLEHSHGAAPGSDNGKGVGQPEYSASCCCVCNEIATTVKGDKNLDCGIARLKADVKFAAKARRIKKADGTTELEGFIEGSDTAVKDHEVWKIGCRTGLTRGTVSQVAPILEIHPIAPFAYFADHGDSGSVVVDTLTSKVVGLLHSIDKEVAAGGTLGRGTPIGPILTLMGITVQQTDETQDFDVLEWAEERAGAGPPSSPDEIFAAAADRLKMSERGRQLHDLVRRHRPEVIDLVNHNRPVMVAWRRTQGPAFLAALMRTAREPAYRLPESIEGVTREAFVTRMEEVLMQHGSAPLRADLQANGGIFARMWLECSTFNEALDAWERDTALVLSKTG